MQKYQNNIQNQFGDAITGATVEVRNVAGGALATLFSDDAVTPLGNPFVAQDASEFFFYAANGRYNITISGPVADTITDVNLFDQADFTPSSSVQDGTADGQMLVWDETVDQAWETVTGIEFIQGANPTLNIRTAAGVTLSGSLRGVANHLQILDGNALAAIDVFTNVIQMANDTRIQGGFFELSNAAGGNRVTFDLNAVASTVSVNAVAGIVNGFLFNGLDVGLGGQAVSGKPAAVTNAALMWACSDAGSTAIYNRGENLSTTLDNLHTASWRFNTPTGAADPAATLFRLNNGNPALVTEIFVDDIDAVSEDADWFLSNVAPNDVLILRTTASRDKYGIYSVTGVTDEGGWWRFEVTVIDAGPTLYTNVDHVQFELQKLSAGGAALAGINGAKAFGNANLNIPDNVNTAIAFNDESFDTDNMHDNVTNNSRLTVPAGITRIRLTAYALWDNNGSSFRQLAFRKDGAAGSIDDDMAGYEPSVFASAANGTVPNLGQNIDSGIITVVAGDYFEVMALQNSGGGLNLLAGDFWFQMELLG